jgi:hypothetical protein
MPQPARFPIRDCPPYRPLPRWRLEDELREDIDDDDPEDPADDEEDEEANDLCFGGSRDFKGLATRSRAGVVVSAETL